MSYCNPFLYVSILLSMCLIPAITFAQTALNYTIYFDEKSVGSMIFYFNPLDGDSYTLEQISHIQSSGIWGEIDVQSQLLESHKDDGSLIKSDNKTRVNDKVYWTKTALFGGEYIASKSELTNDQQKEDAETIEVAKGAFMELVPGVADVMMIGELLLSNNESNTKNNRFTKDNIDTSFLNVPYLWEKSGYTLPKTLRIFDTEEMNVFSAYITYVGEETLDVNGSTVNTKRYTLSVEDVDPTEIWLTTDGQNIPYFFQITGKDDGDIYRIVLSSPKQGE